MAFLFRSAGRRTIAAACALILVFAAPWLFAQTAESNSQTSLLPHAFSGWMEQGTSTTGTTPAGADPSNADVLNEYGLKDFADSTYQRGGAKANVRAMRFADATGAYGAYTFYRKPEMKPISIANGGATDAHEIVFWSGVTVVDVSLNGSAAQIEPALGSLSAALPPPAGSTGVPPTLPTYLPADFLNRSTARYAIGPAAYSRGGGPLPPDVVDFSRDAETVTAEYTIHGNTGTLTLIEYPTPQMAIHTEQALNALLKGPLPAPLQQSSAAALAVRRSGPIVAMTSGSFSAAEAQSLLEQVKYSADVTWNRGGGTGTGEVKNAAKMLIGIAYLTLIVAICALVVGSMLGGGRALWRVMRGKPVSSVYEEDFISLNLSGWNPGPRKLP